MFSLEKRKPRGSDCCLQSLKEQLDRYKFLLGKASERTRCNRHVATQGIMNLVLEKASFTRVDKQWNRPSHAVSILRDKAEPHKVLCNMINFKISHALCRRLNYMVSRGTT